jgi:hypothetical protein
MRAQTQLIDLYGLGAAEVVKMGVTLDHLGVNFDKFLGATAQAGKKFKIPGLMQQTAKVTGHAESLLVKFGKRVVGDAAGIIDSTYRTGAVFAKTYGVDISQAIGMAMQNQQRFAKQAMTDRDVFLGIGKTFDQLSMSMMEAQFSLEQVQELTKVGQEDPIAYARAIRDQIEMLRESGQGFFGDRLERQIQQYASDQVAALVMVEDALEKAEKQQAEFGKGGLFGFKIDAGKLKDFDKLTESLRQIGATAISTVKNIGDLFKTIVGTAFVGVMTKAFQGAIPVLERFNGVIHGLAESFTTSKFWLTIEPYLEQIGKVLVGAGVAAGLFASAMAATVIPVRLFVNGLRAIPLIGKPINASITSLTGGMWDFAKGTFNTVGALHGVAVAFNDFGEALKVPIEHIGKTGLVVRGFRAMALGIVETFDNLLGGLPTWIAKKFFPAMKGTLGDNTKRLFQWLQSYLDGSSGKLVGGWWASIKRYTKENIDKLATYLTETETFGGLLAAAESWGANIGRTIGKLSHWAWEGIKWIFDPENWKAGWSQVTDWIKGDGKSEMDSSWGKILRSMWKMVSTFSVAMVDEILRPFGYGWLEVKSKLLDFYDTGRIVFNYLKTVGFASFKGQWIDLKLALIEGAFEIKDTLYFAFDSTKAYFSGLFNESGLALAKLRKIYYSAIELRDEISLSASMVNNPSWVAAQLAHKAAVASGNKAAIKKTLEIRQSISPVTEAKFQSLESARAMKKIATDDETKFQKGANSSQTLQQEANQRNINRRSASEKFIEDTWGGDRESRAKRNTTAALKAAAEASAAAQIKADNFEKKINSEARVRRGKTDELRKDRDVSRRRFDWLRDFNAGKAGEIRPAYQSATKKILARLAGDIPKLKGDPRQPMVEKLYQSISQLSGKLKDAQTPEKIKSIWKQILFELRAPAPGVWKDAHKFKEPTARNAAGAPAGVPGGAKPQPTTPVKTAAAATGASGAAPGDIVVPGMPTLPAQPTQKVEVEVSFKPGSGSVIADSVGSELNFETRLVSR